MKIFSIKRVTTEYGVKAITKVYLTLFNKPIKLIHCYGMRYYQWEEPTSIMYTTVGKANGKYMHTDFKWMYK